MMVSFASSAAMSAIDGGRSTTYDPTLVALSFVISVFGSLTGLESARRARARTGRASFAWLAAAAVSVGGGAIWSMHFIGMLAYHNDVSYSFSLFRTLLSLVVAVVASGAGLYFVSSGHRTVPRYATGGVTVGIGVAGMHYLGMSAMEMNATLTYRVWVVGISVLIAVIAATAALYLAFNVTHPAATVAAALVLGAGVCGLHYTGMAAAIVTPRLDPATESVGGVNPLSPALPVFGIASVLLFVLLFVGLFEDAERNEGALGAGSTAS
jgi:NO-binding membrane sensor protein with MHYT domain